MTTSRSALRVLALLTAVLVLTACDDPEQDSGPSEPPSEVVERGTLVVCTEIPYAPFVVDEDGDGDPSGFEIELLERMAAGLDLDLEVRPTPYADLDDGRALADDRCDVATGALLVTDERRRRMAFVEPHHAEQVTLLVPAASDVESMADLGGRRLAVQEDSTAETLAAQVAPEDTEVEVLPGDQYMFDALRQGRVDGILQEQTINRAHTLNGRFAVVDRYATGGQYAFAVRRDAGQLRRALDRQLQRLRGDGTFATLREKYFGEG